MVWKVVLKATAISLWQQHFISNFQLSLLHSVHERSRLNLTTWRRYLKFRHEKSCYCKIFEMKFVWRCFFVAKFSPLIIAWRGCIQFLCTHCYDPIRIMKLVKWSRTHEFSATYSRFKWSSSLLLGIVELSIPLAVN